MTRPGEYEQEMRVIFDVLSKTVLITFRGSIHTLGPFANRNDGISAAEAFCRSKGWLG